jgi:V/A-type H+-transporting ATPase subunit E
MSSGTSKIVSSIMSEAQGKADVIIQDANAEVSEIKAKAEKTAEAEKTKILENGKKQSDMRYQQIISEAKMNARRAKLGAKEEVIEAAFNQATGELKAIASSGDEEYEIALTKMIKEAADEIGGDDLIIQLNEADTKKFKDDLSSSGSSDTFELEGINFKIGEPIDAIGGAILKTSNGDIEVNNTIEARLERFKSILRSEVASILFK